MPYDLKNGMLPYPLSELASDGGIYITDFVAGSPEDANVGENWYVLCMDADDFNDLMSVVILGAPIALPDTYNKLIFQILQLREFPNEIPEGSCMDLCQLILDCIGSTPALQQAIAQYSVGSPISDDTGIDTGIAGSDVLIENVGCDNDNLFGMTTGLVDLYNNLAEDIIEELTASANTMGRLGDAIESIPVVGELPVDDALQFTENFLDDIEQNYEAAYTVALRDTYRCDLFCLTQDNCELTFTEIFNYFNDRLITGIILVDWEDLAEYLTNGTFSGTELVDAFHAMVAGLLMLGGDILGINSAKLIQMVSALYNDPDSDWVTLCDECAWQWTHDFLADENIWGARVVSSVDWADWTVDVGYESVDIEIVSPGAEFVRILSIETPEFTPTEITTFAINFDITKGDYATGTIDALTIIAIKNNDVKVRVDVQNQNMVDGDGKIKSLTVNETDIKQLRIMLRSSAKPTAVFSGSVALNSVTVNGVGFNPFL